MGERLHGMQEVRGSSPLSSTPISRKAVSAYGDGLQVTDRWRRMGYLTSALAESVKDR